MNYGGDKMILLYKPDNAVYEIFDVSYDKTGFPIFLFFRRGQWIRMSAKHFTPNFGEDGMGGYVPF